MQWDAPTHLGIAVLTSSHFTPRASTLDHTAKQRQWSGSSINWLLWPHGHVDMHSHCPKRRAGQATSPDKLNTMQLFGQDPCHSQRPFHFPTSSISSTFQCKLLTSSTVTSLLGPVYRCTHLNCQPKPMVLFNSQLQPMPSLNRQLELVLYPNGQQIVRSCAFAWTRTPSEPPGLLTPGYKPLIYSKIHHQLKSKDAHVPNLEEWSQCQAWKRNAYFCCLSTKNNPFHTCSRANLDPELQLH